MKSLYLTKRMSEMPDGLRARLARLVGPNVAEIGCDCAVEILPAEPEINVPGGCELHSWDLVDPSLAEPLRDAVMRILDEWVDGWVAETDPSYARHSAGKAVA